jgi:hypothetical protein
MALPCEACGKPVHETAVDCPHCGESTGVPADPIAEHEIDVMEKFPLPLPDTTPNPLLVQHAGRAGVIDPFGRAVVDGVAKIVGAAAELLSDDDDEPVPRAIARARPKPRRNRKPT